MLDSQFKPHVRVLLNDEKSTEDIRDELSRLIGDLHREENTLRTTVTKDDMTATPLSIRRNPTSTQDIEALVSSVEMMLLGNETMFFGDEEGSGENSGNDEIINTTLPTTTVGTTSRKPLLFTTVIQEVKNAPVTARPDPFAHLDYDLSDHSNLKKSKKTMPKVDRLTKYKLHGGSVEPTKKLNKSSLVKNPTPLIVRPGKKSKFNRRKNLRKVGKIDRMRRVKNLNHRIRAQNRMRIRKVLSKMIFGARDSDVMPNKQKPKLVGSDGIIMPRQPARKLQKNQAVDFQRRDKRDASPQLQFIDSEQEQVESLSAGGAWDTVPIEKSIIESIHLEPHPYYHLKTETRTQVEPSPMVTEASLDDEYEKYDEDENEVEVRDTRPMKNGLVQVSLNGNTVSNAPKRMKMVALNSVKKISKKEKSTNGLAVVAPTAKKQTMLELLIGDFLMRVPPTARNPYLTEEQWS